MSSSSPVATHSESIAIPSIDGLVHWSDAEITAGLASAGAAQRAVETVIATLAAEVKRRSHHSLGHSGLAARAGFGQAADFVQSITGASKSATGSLIAAGELLGGAKPWLGSVVRALESGELSVAAGAAIANGLGAPGSDVSADDLADAAEALVQSSVVATGTSPEQAGTDARRRRAELDVTSVADLEAHRFARRSMTRGKNADGMRWTHIVCDPESDAVLHDAIRTITSPRRVEFRDAVEVRDGSESGSEGGSSSGGSEGGSGSGGALSEGGDAAVREHGERREGTAGRSTSLLDTRTPAQRSFDAFISIVKLGVSTGDDHIFGHNDATVRVHVSAESLVTGDGVSWVEGVDDLQPATTAQRLSCTAGVIPIIVNHAGDVLNVGRTHRLFTTAQRIALSARDGGCTAPGCDVPARFTEAHHINPWQCGGRTDLADGVLLCRFHHRMVHAQSFTITREGTSTYWLNPPPGSSMPRRRLISKVPPIMSLAFATRARSARSKPTRTEGSRDLRTGGAVAPGNPGR